MVFMASTINSVSPSRTTEPTSTKNGAPGSGARYAVPTIGDVTTPGWFSKFAAEFVEETPAVAGAA